MISIAGVKKPGTKSSSSRGEGPSNLKGKGPDLRNWGALSVCEDELDLEAQREALASWKTAQELVRNEQDKPDRSHEGTEPDVEAQRAAIAAWNKVHELAKQESISRSIPSRNSHSSRTHPVRVPSPEGTTRASSPEGPTKILPSGGHVKVLSPEARNKAGDNRQAVPKPNKEKGRRTVKTPDPIRALVDKAIAQDTTRHKRYKTPQAMEPVEQIDPKSYIGLAFERLGGREKKTH